MKKNLEQFHQRLYEKAKEEAESYPSLAAKSIQKYSEAYRSSLPKNFQTTEIQSLLQNIHVSKLFIYGDFHTLKQSQKGFIRVLRAYIESYKKESVIICLEMFKSDHQKYIDDYMRGALSDDEFLEKICYKSEWGFPWEHYRTILEFAKAHDLKVIGINSKGGGRDSLKFRDKYAAEIISKVRVKNPNDTIACLIGEYHLGDRSLYHHLLQNHIKPTRIFTNVDQYYFKQKLQLANHTEYLYLKADSYCVINSPPWIKWQSYCLWEETRAANESNEAIELCGNYDDEIYTSEDVDIDFIVHDLVNHLCRFLQLDHRTIDITHFSLQTYPDQSTFSLLKTKHNISQASINFAINRIATDGFYFEERTNTILIADITYNNLARIAGQFIHNSFREKDLGDLTQPEQFCYRSLNIAAGEVAAKILNPKFQSRSHNYFVDFMARTKKKRLIGSAKSKRESIRRLLHIIDLAKRSAPLRFTSYSQQDRFLSYGISLHLGELIGHSTYEDIMLQKREFSHFKTLFQSASNPTNIPNILLALLCDVTARQKSL